jgi:hypothetical protein
LSVVAQKRGAPLTRLPLTREEYVGVFPAASSPTMNDATNRILVTPALLE